MALFFVALIIIIVFIILGSLPTSCNKNSDCASGEYCVQGTCKYKNGQPCVGNDHCASGYCSDNVCINLPFIDPFTKVQKNPIPVRINENAEPVIIVPVISDDIPKNGIIDMVSYSTYTITLYKNGTMYRDDVKITSNLHPTSLASFYGHLLVVADGKIYALENDTLETNKWVFVSYDDILKDIYHHHGSIVRIGTDLYTEHLYVQTPQHLYIFNRNGLVEQIPYPSTHRRVYGSTLNDYIDIDMEKNVAKVSGGQANGQVMHYVVDAIMDTNGRIHPLTVNRSVAEEYTGVRMTDWMPRYF